MQLGRLRLEVFKALETQDGLLVNPVEAVPEGWARHQFVHHLISLYFSGEVWSVDLTLINENLKKPFFKARWEEDIVVGVMFEFDSQ